MRKCLELGFPVIVVINKIDRSDARPKEVLNEVFDLFCDLDATDEQTDFPTLYAVGREGIAKRQLEDDSKTLVPLFEMILEKIPPRAATRTARCRSSSATSTTTTTRVASPSDASSPEPFARINKSVFSATASR